MGQKVNPLGFRVGVNRGWTLKWFVKSPKLYADQLNKDLLIKKTLSKLLKEALIARIEILRTNQKEIKINIWCVRAGIVLGNNGKNLENISLKIKKLLKNRKLKIKINVIEIQQPSFSADIIATSIAKQIENRVSFRSAQKFEIKKAKRAGIKGIKTLVSGRLNGVDMARSEGYLEGNVPLSTLRNNIEYSLAIAKTTYGAIGVKVWINKGELLNKEKAEDSLDKKTPFKKKYKKFYKKKNKDFRNASTKKN